MREKIKQSLIAHKLLIAVLGVFVLAGSVKAAVPADFWDNVANKVSDKLVEQLGAFEDAFLGASGTRFPNGISADSTSPSAGEVRGTTLTTTGAATISGALTASNGSNVIANPEYSSGVLATSTDSETTGVITQSDLSTYDTFEVSIGSASGMTYTLPASSTLTSVLATSGDKQEFIFRNVTTTAGVDLTLGAGVGTYIEFSSGTPRILASSTAKVLCLRHASTDVSCLFDGYAD